MQQNGGIGHIMHCAGARTDEDMYDHISRELHIVVLNIYFLSVN
jgi:hypothetical protein